MEMLSALEKKIESLILLIKQQKQENEKLLQENNLLLAKKEELENQVRQLEGSLLKEAKQVEKELTQEREATRQVVDDLIKSIDSLISAG